MARVVDLSTAVAVMGGKVEFETGEEGREKDHLTHMLRTATAATARERLAGGDLSPIIAALDGGVLIVTGEQVTAREFLGELPELADSPLYNEVCERLGAITEGERAGALELVLEALYLARKVAKETDGGRTVYG